MNKFDIEQELPKSINLKKWILNCEKWMLYKLFLYKKSQIYFI